VILSILIATLESRRTSFERVYTCLRHQIAAYGYHGRVEIVSNRDSGAKTIGQKRNELLAAAFGDYVCHVDDDDHVADDYIPRLVTACLEDKDCVGIVGSILWHGTWTRFVHSLRHKVYERLADGTFIRPINHLNPVRRSIATRFSFTAKNHGEDTDWAMAMMHADALKSEASSGDEPLYFYTPAPGPK